MLVFLSTPTWAGGVSSYLLHIKLFCVASLNCSLWVSTAKIMPFLRWHKNWNSFSFRIIKLFFRVTYSMLAQRTISSPNNQDVVITIIDNTLDKFELFGVRCRKKFHSCRNAVQTHDCLHHLRTFFFQVCICWTYYYLVSFIHIIHFLKKHHCFNPSKTAFSCSITLSNSSPSHNAPRLELWTCLTCGANVQIIIENGWRNPIKKNRLFPWLNKKKSLLLCGIFCTLWVRRNRGKPRWIKGFGDTPKIMSSTWDVQIPCQTHLMCCRNF